MHIGRNYPGIKGRIAGSMRFRGSVQRLQFERSQRFQLSIPWSFGEGFDREFVIHLFRNFSCPKSPNVVRLLQPRALEGAENEKCFRSSREA